MRAFALALALAAAVAGPALAQKDTVVTEPDRVVAVKKTFIDMTEADVRGIGTKPDGSYSIARKKVRFRNMIELRGDFRPELARSASKLAP